MNKLEKKNTTIYTPTEGNDNIICFAYICKRLNLKTIPLTRLHINDAELDLCHQYIYLGVIVIAIHEKKEKRLWERLKPFIRTLVGKGHGFNVNIARLS